MTIGLNVGFMSAYDVVGYAYDGAFYCEGCSPTGINSDGEEVGAVFAGDEWDYYPTCDSCGAECGDVHLTTDGEHWLKSRQEM